MPQSRLSTCRGSSYNRSSTSIEQVGADRLYGLTNTGDFVAGQVVHGDDIAGLETGGENLLGIGTSFLTRSPVSSFVV